MGRLITILAVLMLAASAGGCGVRGSLDAPAEAKSDTATADSGQGKPEGTAAKPHKDFFLDGLLR